MDENSTEEWPEMDGIFRTKTLALTTFRRSGIGVTTGIWATRIGNQYYFTTPSSTGKVKRLAHTSRVMIEPADGKGRPVGDYRVEAKANPVADSELLLEFRKAMRRKGAIMSRVIELMYKVKRDERLLYELKRP
jgi:uncharacterized protein